MYYGICNRLQRLWYYSTRWESSSTMTKWTIILLQMRSVVGYERLEDLLLIAPIR